MVHVWGGGCLWKYQGTHVHRTSVAQHILHYYILHVDVAVWLYSVALCIGPNLSIIYDEIYIAIMEICINK